jgi:peptide/nickel transport system substrate-binding protein
MLLGVLMLIACASPSARPTASGQPAAAAPTGPVRTLVAIARQEPSSLAATVLLTAGIGSTATRRPFNAGLAMLNGEEVAVPYLAESLPRLNSETWRVLSDGRMETTYRLRPGLMWHDGAALTAEDFVFAWQVYTTPEFGTATTPPHPLMSNVSAPDDRTVVIAWRGPFPGAGALEGLGGAGLGPSFAPLPRHLLQEAHQGARDAFAQLPYWTAQYVGAGPFKLTRWEPGAFVEADAFAGHALGQPKIAKLRMLFISDGNAALAQLLAGEAHAALDDAIGLDQGLTLKREWEMRGAGAVTFLPSIARSIRIQFRPEVARPQALLDLNVRKALAHTIDKQALNESLFHGAALIGETMIPPSIERGLRVETLMPTYPYDPRRAEQLLLAGGYVKDRDGFYTSVADGRLNFEVKNIAQPRNDAERTILASGWEQFGFEIEEASYRPAEAREQALSTFRSLGPTGGIQRADRLLAFTTANIASASNNWIGNNTSGWSNPEFDRVMDRWVTTLDEGERVQQLVQAARILNEQVGTIPLYYAPSVFVFPAALTGVDTKTTKDTLDWNIHTWELR